LNLIALLGLKAPYEVALAGCGSDKPENVQLAGLRHDVMVTMSKSLYPRDQDREPSKELQFLDDGKIACLRYSSFGIDIDEARVFMKRSFEEIQSKGSKTLILDMRGNLGGEGEIGSILFSYLVDQPFKYYDDLIVNKSSGMSYSFAKYTDKHRDLVVPPGLAELRADGKGHQTNDSLTTLQQPGKPGFKGTVYILINGRCFSSGAEFLTEVHFHHRATFIGEESAGAYYGNNSSEVERITLPNTKLGLFIPFVSGYMSVGGTHDHEPARGIIPDFPVKRTIADLLAGVDKDFELALELSRKSR
jgi:C-terminal processing protease CtpA/Prc